MVRLLRAARAAFSSRRSTDRNYSNGSPALPLAELLTEMTGKFDLPTLDESSAQDEAVAYLMAVQ